MSRPTRDLYSTGRRDPRGVEEEPRQVYAGLSPERMLQRNRWWGIGYVLFLIAIGAIAFYFGRQQQRGQSAGAAAPAETGPPTAPGTRRPATTPPESAGPPGSALAREPAVSGAAASGAEPRSGRSLRDVFEEPASEDVASGPGEPTRERVDPETIDRARQMIAEAKRLNGAGEHVKALEMLDNALKLLPDMVGALEQKASIFIELSQYEAAHEALLRAIELAPTRVLLYNNLGYVQARLSRYDEAIDSYRTAVQMQPDYVPGLYNLALLYMDRGRYLDALPLLESAVRLAPANVEVLTQVSLALVRTRETQMALQFLDKARSIEPENGQIMMVSALAYAARNDLGAAAGWVEQAIELVRKRLLDAQVVRNYLRQPEFRVLEEQGGDRMSRLRSKLTSAELGAVGTTIREGDPLSSQQ